VYTYDELRAWLSLALGPAWSIHVPSVLGDMALSTAWPAEQPKRDGRVSERAIIEGWLHKHGCADPGHFLDGACEPLAVALGREVQMHLVARTLAPDRVADTAHHTLQQELSQDGAQAAERVFGGCFARGFVDGRATWSTEVWGERYEIRNDIDGGGAPEEDPGLVAYLYGCRGAQKRIAALAAELDDADDECQRVAAMPLYVLTYIWDADELSEEDMHMANADETAQYSCHVVGLVLDATRRVLVVADPNGGLLPGGCMEFLAVPPRPRAPSTSRAQFDIDENEAAQRGRGCMGAAKEVAEEENAADVGKGKKETKMCSSSVTKSSEGKGGKRTMAGSSSSARSSKRMASRMTTR